MIITDHFKELLDSVPFPSYMIDIKTFEVIYINELMKEHMYDSGRKECWEKIFGQREKCSWCGLNDLINNPNINIKESNTSEFFDEIEDKWFISHDKIISLNNCINAKYSILVDISQQKESQGKIIQSHAKLAMYSKHLAQTNENLKITKILLQKKSDELVCINNNLEKIVRDQLSKIRKQDQLLFLHQKQASLNNIMSIIAHQWKQPLHELSINNIYLNENNKNNINNKVYQDNSEIIQFLSSTITAFQDFYTVSCTNTFLIKNAIENTILILNSSIRLYKININFDSNNINIELSGQRNIFSQVILSVLENAISIFIERNIYKPYINIRLQQVNHEIHIIIADNAGGIDEKDLPYIFDNSKSFREKNSTGLGLYIASLIIIEKFKGTISARNNESGAVFLIIIPCV